MNCLFLFVISFISDIASLFLNLWENLLIKDLLTKKRVKYYSDKFASKTKLLNCLLPFEETCHCIELEPALIQNAKTSTAFFKRGEIKIYQILFFF